MQDAIVYNDNTINIESGFRTTKQFSAKGYMLLCKFFAPLYIAQYEKVADRYGSITGIAFMKQDSRGVPSITLFNSASCVPHQKHFGSYAEMESFMRGFMCANETSYI